MRLGQGLTLITFGAVFANQKVWERRREAALMPRPVGSRDLEAT